LLNADPLSGLSKNQLNKIDCLVLPSFVSEQVCVDFHGACVLWVLGCSFPRFYAYTSLHTGIALENALRTVLSKQKASFGKRDGLAKLFSVALKKKFIDDSQISDSEYLTEFVELHSFRQNLEFDMADIAEQIGERHKPNIFPSLIEDLVKAIRDVRNEIAHGNHKTTITESIARHHLELGRIIILALFCAQRIRIDRESGAKMGSNLYS